MSSRPRGLICAVKHHDRPRPRLVLGGYDDEPHLRRKYDKPAHRISYAKPYLAINSIDGQVFQIDEVSCMESICFNNAIKDRPCDWTYVQLPSFILEKVIYFIENHAHIRRSGENQKLKDFHSKIFKQNHTLHFELMEAAYMLNIKSLFDLTSEAVVDMITGKTREEILKILNLKNYFTFQEMAEIRKEKWWAFE